MAKTRSALRSELAARLNRFTVSADLQTQLNYALDAGLTVIASDPDRQEGITKRDLVGWTWGSLSVTSIACTQGSSSVTLAGETLLSKNVFAGDILAINFSDGAERYLIYGVTNDTTINLGAPLRKTEAVSGTIYRRTVKLPTTGLVVGASVLTTSDFQSARPLRERRKAALLAPLELGEPEVYSVAYDPGNDAAYVGFYYAPENARPFVIGITDVPPAFADDASTLDWPDQTIHTYLEVCREIAIVWMGSNDPVLIQAAERNRRQAADGLYNAATGQGVYARP